MKSGTSFIQHSLDHHTDALAEQGIAWLGTQATNRAVQDLLQGAMRMPGSGGAWGRLARRIRESDGDAVVSMEMLGPTTARVRARLAHTLQPHRLRLLVTMRDITRVAPSHWQTSTQNRGRVGWDEYAERISCAADLPADGSSRFWRHHDIPALITRYSDIVALSDATVVTVPASRTDAALLWTRFASVLGAQGLDDITAGGENQALGAVSAELMIRLNERIQDLDWLHYRRGVRTPLAKRTLRERSGQEPRYVASPEQHTALRKKALGMVDEIERSPATVVGDLAEVIPPHDPPDSAFTTDDLTDEMLLEAALDGLSGLARMTADLRIQRDALEVRVAQLGTRQVPPAPARHAQADRPAGRRLLSATARRVPGLAALVRRVRAKRPASGHR